jgi:hypothetical protein
MADHVNDIISIFEDLQNECITLFEKNNIDEIKRINFREEQKIKLFNFKSKLLDYKLNIVKNYTKRESNLTHNKEDLNWWNSNFGK